MSDRKWFGEIRGPRPYRLIWLGDIRGPWVFDHVCPRSTGCVLVGMSDEKLYLLIKKKLISALGNVCEPGRASVPRPGPRSMCTEVQPGRPILRPFREFC